MPRIPKNIIREVRAGIQAGDTNGAEYSPCELYRYALWRNWHWDGYDKRLIVIGLNPSTATETIDDPTIRRCIRFAKSWDLGGYVMLNLFGFRSTDPAGMKAAADPVGLANDDTIRRFAIDRPGALTLAAWGNHGSHRDRAREVVAMFKAAGVPLYCLAVNRDGSPKHPLYIRADRKPVIYGG